jgi:uncharacterized membrane protein YuzA (DUF378 family)
MKTVDLVAAVLLVVAGLNWGLVGFFNYDLVSHILGSGMPERVAYGIVGLAALRETIKWLQAKCAKSS